MDNNWKYPNISEKYALAVRHYLRVAEGADADNDRRVVLGRPWEITWSEDAYKFLKHLVSQGGSDAFKHPRGVYLNKIISLCPHRVYSPCLGVNPFLQIKTIPQGDDPGNPVRYLLGLVLDYDVKWVDDLLDVLKRTEIPPAFRSLSASDKFHLIWLIDPIIPSSQRVFTEIMKRFIRVWSADFNLLLQKTNSELIAKSGLSDPKGLWPGPW